MPWCPVCKNEYIEGMTHCPDCDEDLVEELTKKCEASPTEQELPEDFDPKEFIAAVSAMKEAEKERPEPAKTYKSPEERYSDVRSSAFTFLFLGLLGTIAAVLSWLDILKLPVNDFFRVVMTLLFLIFLGVGIYSFRSLKKLKTNITTENSFKDQVIEWFRTTGSASPVFNDIDPDLPEEMRYFQRSELIRTLLKEQFPEIDQALLEKLTDDFCEEAFEE